MAKRRFSFIASLVIAVSICSLCASTPAMASTRNGSNKHLVSVDTLIGKAGSGITDAMTTKNEDGSNKQTEAITYGAFNSKDSTKLIIVGHKFKDSEINLIKGYAKDEGLDFDRLYNGYEGIAADTDSQYDNVRMQIYGTTPRYGWVSVKDTKLNKTFWGYCDDLKAGFVKSGWKFIGNKWYYFNANGLALDSTTQTIEGKSYSFNADCSLFG